MNEKPFRSGVIVAIRNPQGMLLAGERYDTKRAWQLPQGGIDPNETAEQALKRELMEEIGCDDFVIHTKISKPVCYDFPENFSAKIASKFRGQCLTWFLVELKKGAKPDLTKALDKEFQELKWLSPVDILNKIVIWKKHLYEQGFKSLELI